MVLWTSQKGQQLEEPPSRSHLIVKKDNLRWEGGLGWSCSEDGLLTSDDVLRLCTQNPIDLAASSTVSGNQIVSQSEPCNNGQILVYDFGIQVGMWRG